MTKSVTERLTYLANWSFGAGILLATAAPGTAWSEEKWWDEVPLDGLWYVLSHEEWEALWHVNGTLAYSDIVAAASGEQHPCREPKSTLFEQMAAGRAPGFAAQGVKKNNLGHLWWHDVPDLQFVHPGDWNSYYTHRYGAENRGILDQDVANGILVDLMQVYQVQINPGSVFIDYKDDWATAQETPCDPVGFFRDPSQEMTNGVPSATSASGLVAHKVAQSAGLAEWNNVAAAKGEEECDLELKALNHSKWFSCAVKKQEQEDNNQSDALRALYYGWCTQADGTLLPGCILGASPLLELEDPLDCRGSSGVSLSACFMPSVGVVRIEREEPQRVNLYCSATVISDDTVLTAAHCVCSKPQAIALGTQTGGHLSDYVQTRSGAYVYTNPGGTGRTSSLFRIANIDTIGGEEQLDKDCDLSKVTGSFPVARDLAIIRVEISEAFADASTQAIVVPKPPDGDVINLAGFGPDEADREARKETRRVISSNFIRAEDGIIYVQDMHSKTRDNDSCPSDSGSGAYLRMNDGTLGLFAVLSGGARQCGAYESRYVDLASPEVQELLAHVEGIKFVDTYSVAENMSDCIGKRCKE